ncbi:microtubule-associated protein 9-like [Halichondria panicea]|uniref:microtubule-associated protein 9-like n=1 Tax=Halichondria panicea TaxID=6063 RepID=UPI00312BB924
MSSNRKESEEEELRRLERNRVAFEAWVQKKKEEKKGKLAMEQAAQREQAASRRQQRDVGRLAFQRWLKTKQNEDSMKMKEKAYLNQVEKLRQQSKAEEQRRAKDKVEMWRTQKDFETRLQRENERQMTKMLAYSPRESTPSLPGYVSVWSCDSELAEFMVDRVDRGSHLLSHTGPNTDSQPSDSPITIA